MAILGLDTPMRQTIFVSYMALWVTYGMLAWNAKEKGVVFSTAGAVMLTSILKLGIAIGLYLQQDGTPSDLVADLKKHIYGFVIYLIPSGAYALYDNLAYVNLRVFDPATYFTTLQCRLVLTGFIFQQFFRKPLSQRQWFALLIITLGCIFKNAGVSQSSGSNESYSYFWVLIGFQILSATFGTVYNEFLLKSRTEGVNLQNIFMYTDSIVFNLVVLMLRPEQNLSDLFTWDTFGPLLSIQVLPMIVLMSVVGLVTSIFLKYLNSVLKAIASALELVIIPVVQLLLFGIAVDTYVILSVVMVAAGIYLYSVKGETAVQQLSSAKKDYLQVPTHAKTDPSSMEEGEEE